METEHSISIRGKLHDSNVRDKMCCSDPPSSEALLPGVGYGQHQPQLLASAIGSNAPQRATLPKPRPATVAEQGGDRKNHPSSPKQDTWTGKAGDGTPCRPGQDLAGPASQFELCLCPILLPAYLLSQGLIPNKPLRP